MSIRDLVRNSLRMRPDRIIVGEVRGAEALDMLQAMNTGHDGSLSTVHANSPRDALARLETMVMMAGFDLPLRAIRQQISSALDLIVQIERHRGRQPPRHLDHRGAADGGRRDHAAGALHLQARAESPASGSSSAASSRPGCARPSSTSSRSAASRSRRGSSTSRTGFGVGRPTGNERPPSSSGSRRSQHPPWPASRIRGRSSCGSSRPAARSTRSAPTS